MEECPHTSHPSHIMILDRQIDIQWIDRQIVRYIVDRQIDIINILKPTKKLECLRYHYNLQTHISLLTIYIFFRISSYFQLIQKVYLSRSLGRVVGRMSESCIVWPRQVGQQAGHQSALAYLDIKIYYIDSAPQDQSPRGQKKKKTPDLLIILDPASNQEVHLIQNTFFRLIEQCY